MGIKCCWYYDSPIGKLFIGEEDGAVVRLDFEGGNKAEAMQEFELRETALIRRAGKQLKEYFAEKRQEFDLPLVFEGTDFQRKVWGALLTIQYGETRSYGEIAAQVGNPKGARAVGMANNRNPIAIICPCHRVIGADGSLVGFGGGLAMKEYLLGIEK